MSIGDELQRRESNSDKLRAFFEQHPGEWIQPKDGLEQAAGRYAWRSRLPKVRRDLKHDNAGVIEWNKQNGPGTAYRFLPYRPIGSDAATPRTEKHPPKQLPLV